MGFPGSTVAKNLPANAGDVGDSGLIPGSGRSPGGGNCHPLQYPCLKNPMDRGTWQGCKASYMTNWAFTCLCCCTFIMFTYHQSLFKHFTYINLFDPHTMLSSPPTKEKAKHKKMKESQLLTLWLKSGRMEVHSQIVSL